MTHVLDIAQLTFAWGKRAVLRDVDLRVSRGEFVSLLGPNGSGKSTILAIIAGLARPYGGAIRWTFDGQAVPPGDLLARQRIGVVFQSPSLDQSLSARENLTLAARMAGLGRTETRRRIHELLDLAELADRADERVKQLSGGMRRRIDLARALLHEPEVLLLDEPTAGLDHPSFERFWQRLATVRQQRRLTVLCATHRPDEAARSDRLVMISEGRIAYEGTPDETIRALGNDLLVLQTPSPEAAADQLRGALGLTARVTAPDALVCEVPPETDGAALIVRIVETLPRGSLDAISLRRPDLGDAFVKIVGNSLDGDPAPRAQEAA